MCHCTPLAPGKPCSEVGTADQKRPLWAPTVPHNEAADQPPSRGRCHIHRTFQLFRPPNLGQPLTALRLLPGAPVCSSLAWWTEAGQGLTPRGQQTQGSTQTETWGALRALGVAVLPPFLKSSLRAKAWLPLKEQRRHSKNPTVPPPRAPHSWASRVSQPHSH